MPRRELKHPSQVEALLWHAAQRGIAMPLPENSMDVDPITAHEEVAELGYEAHIGSPFEKENGWHVNLMPAEALSNLPGDWHLRAARKDYGLLRVIVPTAANLLVPKLERGEPRDHAHAEWARRVGLC